MFTLGLREGIDINRAEEQNILGEISNVTSNYFSEQLSVITGLPSRRAMNIMFSMQTRMQATIV